MIYAHTTTLTLPTCDMSLGSLTVGMRKAGDFVESVEPYPHLQSGMRNICMTVARQEGSRLFYCVAQYFATGLQQVAAYSNTHLPSVKPVTPAFLRITQAHVTVVTVWDPWSSQP